MIIATNPNFYNAIKLKIKMLWQPFYTECQQKGYWGASLYLNLAAELYELMTNWSKSQKDTSFKMFNTTLSTNLPSHHAFLLLEYLRLYFFLDFVQILSGTYGQLCTK